MRCGGRESKFLSNRSVRVDSDYIAFLRDIADQQVDSDSRAKNIANYKTMRAKQFGTAPSGLSSSQILSWVEQDPATAQTRYLKEVIYDPIVKLLPPRDQEKLASTSLIALPNRSVNGCSLRCPNGDPLIVIDSGLLSLLSFLRMNAGRKCSVSAKIRPFS